MLAANLLTNDVNKEERPNDSVARPGWDEHLGYGIIDLEKAIKAIDSFQNGYFTSFDTLPYYEGPLIIWKCIKTCKVSVLERINSFYGFF